jgi:hypothetical protein
MGDLFIQTEVPGLERVVLVSTVSIKGDMEGGFRTSVFPLNAQGIPNAGEQLYEKLAGTSREAKRDHGKACKKFDKERRPYVLVGGEYQPVGEVQ